jgi:Zn-dependent protease/CBS domain-containing protein
MRNTWQIGKILGIAISIDLSWLIIFTLVVVTLAGDLSHERWFDMWAWVGGFIGSLIFFASVLLHELAHSIVARASGIPVQGITLFVFGGVSEITEEPGSPLTEFLVAVVGPLMSLLLASLFGIVWLLTQTGVSLLAVNQMAAWLGLMNGSLAVFNLAPGFPLDGGRVLRALLWGLTHDMKSATRWASYAGQGLAILIVILGIGLVLLSRQTLSGLWLILIGWFLSNAAGTGYRQVVVRDILRDVHASDLMARQFQTVPPTISLQSLVDDHIFRSRDHSFLVTDDHHLVGLICLHDVKAVPKERWAFTTVREAMTPRDRLVTTTPRDPGSAILEKLSQYDVRQLPVMEGDELVGLIRRDDLLHYVQAKMELGSAR